MPTPRPYTAGDGATYQRSLTNASQGTNDNPDVAYFALDYPVETDKPIDDATMPTGGLGIIGWLSGIWRNSSSVGQAADSVATTDAGTFGLIPLVKRGLQHLTSLINIFNRPTILYVTGTISSSGDNTIVTAPGAGLSIYVTHIVLQNESATATTIILKDSANRLRCLGQNQGNGIALTFSERREIKLATNTALVLNLSGANQVGYSIGYYTGA